MLRKRKRERAHASPQPDACMQPPLLLTPPPQGAFTPAIESDLKELSAMLCLSAKDASDIRSEIAAGLYRKLLKEEVASRRIDQATSPAKVLGDLVARSGFSPEAAVELHKSLYRSKMNQVGWLAFLLRPPVGAQVLVAEFALCFWCE